MTMLEPGEVFAERYQIVRLLASGGMGAVFEARHLGTERHVALKLLWPHVLAVDSAREKFQLEAKVAARVQSEHIVHVLDAGFDPQSRTPYLAMELLNGGTLAALVEREGPQSHRVTVNLLQQVARGLDAAHGLVDERGRPAPIVHRDLKPENLLLSTRPGEAPTIKILDFGIAKVASESRNMSHEVRGTPMYMAFEQVVAGPLSGQTDVWALGLIAYYLLTGHRFWRTATDPDAGIQALFAEIVTLPIPPASARMREQGLKPALPDEFDAWLARCLDRVPSRRFESAGSAVIALEAALRGRSASQGARPAPQGSRPLPVTMLDPAMGRHSRGPGATPSASPLSASSWSGARPTSAGSASMLSVPGIENPFAARRGGGVSRYRWLVASGLLAGLLLLIGVGVLVRSGSSTGEGRPATPAAAGPALDERSAGGDAKPTALPASASSPAAPFAAPASTASMPARVAPMGGAPSAAPASTATRAADGVTVRPLNPASGGEPSEDRSATPYWQAPSAPEPGAGQAVRARPSAAASTAHAVLEHRDRSSAPLPPRPLPATIARPAGAAASSTPAASNPPAGNPAPANPGASDSPVNPFDMR